MQRSGYWPRSFLKLAWGGLLLVSVPLGVALVGAGMSSARLAGLGAQGLEQATAMVGDARALVDQVVGLERKARQLTVLGDPTLLRDYAERGRKVREIVRRMVRLPLPPEDLARLRNLARVEESVRAVLLGGPPAPGDVDAALVRFADLHRMARETAAAANRFVLDQAERIRQEAARLERRLFWQMLAVVPLTLALAAVFAYLLASPIRAIDQAIHRMGEGRFDRVVSVAGPRDLVFLGERLEWLRRRLVELEEEKTRFLAHLSHDLKTPLTAIREGAELLASGVTGRLEPEQAEVARIVRENCLQLQRQLENLLTYSLGEVQDRREPPGAVDLAEVVRSAAEDLAPAARARGIEVRLEVEPVPVLGHQRRLRSVVENLLSNALKFTPRGGRVGVRLRAEGERVVMEVWDSGPGIPAEERDRVFEPFFQGTARGEGPVRGSGLGLAIVREYVESHGGTVEVLAEDQGGARFRIVLPGSDAPRPGAGDVPGGGRGSRPNG